MLQATRSRNLFHHMELVPLHRAFSHQKLVSKKLLKEYEYAQMKEQFHQNATRLFDTEVKRRTRQIVGQQKSAMLTTMTATLMSNVQSLRTEMELNLLKE